MNYRLSTEQVNNILKTLDEDLSIEDICALHLEFNGSYAEVWSDSEGKVINVSVDLETEEVLDEQD